MIIKVNDTTIEVDDNAQVVIDCGKITISAKPLVPMSASWTPLPVYPSYPIYPNLPYGTFISAVSSEGARDSFRIPNGTYTFNTN